MATNIDVVGNKVSIPDISRTSAHNHDDTLVFVGKMDYEPNVIAVTYFVNRILPGLRLLHPNLRFMIVGVKPCKKVKQLANHPNVFVTGYVEYIEPFFREATIVVAPMLTGAGIQNKIIQAMAYGCCVVTTPIGAEGLDIRNDEIAIFRDEQQMREGIAMLLDDRGKRKAMGSAAREYVIQNLSASIIANQFWHFLSDI